MQLHATGRNVRVGVQCSDSHCTAGRCVRAWAFLQAIDLCCEQPLAHCLPFSQPQRPLPACHCVKKIYSLPLHLSLIASCSARLPAIPSLLIHLRFSLSPGFSRHSSISNFLYYKWLHRHFTNSAHIKILKQKLFTMCRITITLGPRWRSQLQNNILIRGDMWSWKKMAFLSSKMLGNNNLQWCNLNSTRIYLIRCFESCCWGNL